MVLSMTRFSPSIRPRRLRAGESIRALVQENRVLLEDLVQPLFVTSGEGIREEIAAMPGQFRFSVDQLIREVGELLELGVFAVALFPVLPGELKDRKAKESWNPRGLFPTAIRAVKKHFPDVLVISDVAMDPYSSDGHDGLVHRETGKIINDESLSILSKMALVQAEAGADIIAPSDMMDHRVGFIREALDNRGFFETGIMSYSAKYCSAFYGPFRQALDSVPRGGDKKTYQMDPANIKEARREIELDQEEGADILMIKPGLPYLDVLNEVRRHTTLPLAAYHVSGEYAMIKAASARNFLHEERTVDEVLLCFKRAGADMIFTYFAKDWARRRC